MTFTELTEKLAQVQTALYALQQAENLTAAQRLDVMRLHGEIGDAVYDAMTGDLAADLDTVFAEACKYGEPRWEMCMQHMSEEEFIRRCDERSAS